MPTPNTLEARVEEVLAIERGISTEESFAPGTANFAQVGKLLACAERPLPVVRRRILKALLELGSECRPALYHLLAHGPIAQIEPVLWMLGPLARTADPAVQRDDAQVLEPFLKDRHRGRWRAARRDSAAKSSWKPTGSNQPAIRATWPWSRSST